MKKTLIFFLFAILISINVRAQKASKIWIVRHAEKQTIDPKNANPALNAEGEKRAEDLAEYLKKEKVDYIFSTDYLRTKQTAAPLAKQKGLEIETYNPKNHAVLVQKIKSLPQGKNSLIVGHSNTVLEILALLGGTAPVKTLTDDDYDFLFKLSLKRDKVKVKTGRFGESHHSTELK
ncbi:SixA phosphatase family protein [Pedobacter cryophilus]|uniref:Histidine phosphatase family protein n=1 Tax=Pedobacter cryophilus TaxID=2571271 RepID=A0A4V5NXS8_9SPHI|nr:phosphoglycerate mutase family protein [Pedobacter cryophilus]TKC00641.1 histidine phosphatase family protein [Pedobacter cryophilus]